jgi:hypothetical protein
MSVLDRLFHLDFLRSRAAREEAERRGVSVATVGRPIPIFARSGRCEGLEPHQCVRYSVARHPTASATAWAFVQRDTGSDPRFPHGWRFEGPETALTAPLGRVLGAIATEWQEELLEFEATPEGRLHAYWEQWGGAAVAGRIVGYLEALAQAEAVAA